MDEYGYVYATAGVMALYFIIQMATKRFDPFAPVWLFFVGYFQLYVIQALSYHDWAVGVRGVELVTAANQQALWALIWYLFVYHVGVGNIIAPRLPSPPRGWSNLAVMLLSPGLILWGLFCSGVMGGTPFGGAATAEEALFRSFPFVMMVAAIMLIVSGRRPDAPKPVLLWAGLATSFAYIVIWMFNGKRSHSLIAVLATVCAFYISRQKRPSWPVLLATSFTGAMVVSLALGWRGNMNYERTLSGFVEFVGDFDFAMILENMDVVDETEGANEEHFTYETKEYGGFLLMKDTVPEKSDYDYGANYIRTFSTFIPRIVWPDKPLFGRQKWINAWIVGSEMDRQENYTSPAIGLLGATQLNGGAIGTIVVVAVIAILHRCCYAYFRMYADVPWVQFWWALAFFNAWFMVVNDDPMVWFYYNWGFTTFPFVVLLWWICRGAGEPPAEAPAATWAESGVEASAARSAGFSVEAAYYHPGDVHQCSTWR